MEYLYFLENASLTLRVVKHLQANLALSVQFVTTIHQVDGWLVFIKTNELLPQQAGDLKAIMSELGIPYSLTMRLEWVLASLAAGELPVNVMKRYQVAIVAHGRPNANEIEAFCRQFTTGLGYCPKTLI